MPKNGENGNGNGIQSRSEAIRERLEEGAKPAELVQEGFPRSSVYYVYKSFRKTTRKDIQLYAKASALEDVEALDELHDIAELHYPNLSLEAQQILALSWWDRLTMRRELQGAVGLVQALTQGYAGMAQALASERSQATAAEVNKLGAYLEQRLDGLEHKRKDIAEAPNPMMGLMARTMETMMDRVMGMMLPGAPSGGAQGSGGSQTGLTGEVAASEEDLW